MTAFCYDFLRTFLFRHLLYDIVVTYDTAYLAGNCQRKKILAKSCRIEKNNFYHHKPIHMCLISAHFGEGSEAGIPSHGGIQHECPSGSRASAKLGKAQRKQTPSAPPKRAAAVSAPHPRTQKGTAAVKPGEETRQREHTSKQCAPSATATFATTGTSLLLFGLANAADFTVLLIDVASSFNDQTPSAPTAAAATTAATRAPAGLLRSTTDHYDTRHAIASRVSHYHQRQRGRVTRKMVCSLFTREY